MPRFLVVDDSRTVRLAVGDALRTISAASDVVEAADGAAAVARFEAERAKGAPFDVVFLDMMMPGAPNGLGVLTQILDVEPATRVAIVTALPSDHPDVLQARALGAFAVVEKPVRLDSIRAVVDLLAREGGRMRRIG